MPQLLPNRLELINVSLYGDDLECIGLTGKLDEVTSSRGVTSRPRDACEDQIMAMNALAQSTAATTSSLELMTQRPLASDEEHALTL